MVSNPSKREGTMRRYGAARTACTGPFARFRLEGILLGIAAALSGCGKSDATATSTPIGHDSLSSVPVVAESLDEIRDRMQQLVLHDQEKDRFIISPERQNEFDQWKLKALIKLDEVRRREGVAGFEQKPVDKTSSQSGAVDPASNRIAWRAFTCWNPACLGAGKGGGPLMFVVERDNAEIQDGKLKYRTLRDDEKSAPAVCPKCGRMDLVCPYDEPAVELRRRELQTELTNARDVRARCEAEGKLVPATVRPPTEIMKESDQLPKLFLLKEGNT